MLAAEATHFEVGFPLAPTAARRPFQARLAPPRTGASHGEAIRMIPADTRSEAHRAQIDAYRRMSGTRRVQIALEMSEATRQLAADGIRFRHPDYTAQEVQDALFRLMYGEEMLREAFPSRRALEP